MTVKNTSSKIIAFGSNTLLPGDTCDLDKSWETNDVVKMYMERNMLQRVEAAPGVTPDTYSNTTGETAKEPETKESEVKEPEVKETKSKK